MERNLARIVLNCSSHGHALGCRVLLPPDVVMEDWSDWYQLAPAFVATYGTEELQELEGASVLLEAIEEQDDVSLTVVDLAYLRALEAWLDMYPEMRTTEE